MFCGRCGGRNTTDSICPECGSPPWRNALADGKQDVSVIAPKLESLRIPKAYLGKSWSADMFWSSHQGKRSNKLVSLFVRQLEAVHNMFVGGGLPDRSALFLAPAGYSKMTWAYSCMQYAITNGYEVAPMLDTLELKRLLVLSADRPKQSVVGVTYEDYVESDVLFLTVTKTEYRRGASDVLAELLDKRSRRGKGVIALSRVSVSEMSHWDSSHASRIWYDPADPVDPFKIPSIITCL